jgi:hypothetical protein
MDIKRTLVGIATLVAAGTLAAGAGTAAASTGVHHDMINQAIGNSAVAVDSATTSGASSSVHHDM